jgi:CRP/FNR family transcriptional regulator, cyclic AMP receptor protein
VAVDVDVLRKVPLFADLDNKEAKKVASLFKERSFASGDVVAEEGKHGIGFFVIESGAAKVLVGGNEVASLGPGSHFGEIALIDDGPRTATITADSDLKCHVLIAWDFRPLVKSDSTLAWALLEGLARMLRSAQQRES